MPWNRPPKLLIERQEFVVAEVQVNWPEPIHVAFPGAGRTSLKPGIGPPTVTMKLFPSYQYDHAALERWVRRGGYPSSVSGAEGLGALTWEV